MQNIEEIVSLIALADSSLIVAFIQNVIDCNKSEWQTIDAMLDPNERAVDNSMNQILKKTAIYDVTKYLYNRKNQATFLENSNHRNKSNRSLLQMHDEDEENEDSSSHNLHEDEVWELWKNGMDHFNKKKKVSKYYYALRAFGYAQMT